jgi:phosphotriesterase-related protein
MFAAPSILQAAGSLNRRQVMTVLGPIKPQKLGLTLSHEHVLVDFIGADQINRSRYKADEAFRVILPYLKEAKELGCRGFVECTPSYIGKDPLLLRRLARASRLHILTNTGYYGAAENKFLPPHAYTESAEQLSGRWLIEWRDGIEGSGIRPGFIKIGVGGESLSELHRKLVRAAALTHRASGLTIASHTGPARLALEQLAVLHEQGLRGDAFVWVHAQSEGDMDACFRVAAQGAWVSYDGYSPTETARYVNVFREFKDRGCLDQLLLSHDAGWFHPGEPNGGQFRPFGDLFRDLLPELRRSGISETDIRLVTTDNPARAFSVHAHVESV